MEWEEKKIKERKKMGGRRRRQGERDKGRGVVGVVGVGGGGVHRTDEIDMRSRKNRSRVINSTMGSRVMADVNSLSLPRVLQGTE